MNNRRIDGFFYGLFMDEEVSHSLEVAIVTPRPAYVDGYALRIGKRATLIADEQARAYGMVLAMNHDELNKLYSAPGLEDYQPEPMIANVIDGPALAVLGYNLKVPPTAYESNPDYAQKLRKALRKMAFRKLTLIA